MTISTQRRRHGTEGYRSATESLTHKCRSRCGSRHRVQKVLGNNERREQMFTETCHGGCHFTTDSSERAKPTLTVWRWPARAATGTANQGSSSSQRSLHGSDMRAQTQELQLVVAVMPTHTRVRASRTHAYTDAHCYHQRTFMLHRKACIHVQTS